MQINKNLPIIFYNFPQQNSYYLNRYCQNSSDSKILSKIFRAKAVLCLQNVESGISLAGQPIFHRRNVQRPR